MFPINLPAGLAFVSWLEINFDDFKTLFLYQELSIILAKSALSPPPAVSHPPVVKTVNTARVGHLRGHYS